MKTLKNITFSFMLIVAAACSNAEKATIISQTELMSRIGDNSSPVILDVRSIEEYNRSHVPGAINIPYDSYQSALAKMKLAKGSQLVVYCESGRRASKVENHLKEQGFFEVRHLEGDMGGWRKAGLATE